MKEKRELSQRRKKTGSEVMKVNATELIADLIDKLENLVRENERLKAEIEMLKNKQ